nr:hypothetical protein CFP56_67706 [Quercus suber]
MLLVFGVLYTLVEYLLLATRVTACSPVTVFVPVTSTMTVTTFPSSLIPTYMVASTSTITVTSTSVLTNVHTTTMFPEVSAATAVTSAGGASYFYSIVSGTTSWLNGVSPISGMALTTATTSINVIPLSTVPDTTIHLTSTSTLTETVTVPEYTSTVYSLAPVDLTTTSYSTVYTTISVYDATTISSPRPSFHSIGHNGWNATSLASSLSQTGVEAIESKHITTMTGVYFWGTKSRTTSTSTRYLTTTLHVTKTTTLWPDSSIGTLESSVSPTNVSPTMTVSSTLTNFPTLIPGTSGIFESIDGSASGVVHSFTVVSPVAYATGQGTITSGASIVYSSVTDITGHATSSTLVSTLPTHITTSGPVMSVAQVLPPSYDTPSTFPMNSSIDLYSMSVLESPVISAGRSVSIVNMTPSSWSTSYFNASGSSPSLLGYLPSTPLMSSIASTISSAATGSSASVSTMTATTQSAVSSSSWTTRNVTSSTAHVATSSESPLQSLVSPHSHLPMYSSAIESASQSPVPSAFTSQLSQSVNVSVAMETGISTVTAATLTTSYSSTFATDRPSSCGESGTFALTFDDLPNFNPSRRNNTDITQAPPVPNPYKHLTFSDGYVYAPQPNESYTPQSAPHLAVFLADGRGRTTSTLPIGEITDGVYESSSAFWFDAHSVWLGCDNTGPEECTIIMTGYTWSDTAADEIAAFEQNATIPACSGQASCALQQRFFPASFVGLSGLQMQAYVGSQSRMFFLDDLALSWTNNSCEAGLIRQTHR